MRFVRLIFLLITAVGAVLGAGAPLTVKEIALMLRSGYSNQAVLQELSTRKLADTFDAEAEAQLIKSGASSTLINSLRSGQYQASESQIAAIKTKLTKEEQSKSLPATPNEPVVQSVPSPVAAAHDSILTRLKGDLVYLHERSLVPFDDELLEQKKFYLLFFSANWSPPGRKFTADLINYYNQVAPGHPEFEIIFFSADRSQFSMESYMIQTAMPWPAVAYDKLSGKAGKISNGLVQEIPCLVFADATGKILSRSQSGESPVTLAGVLQEADRILGSVHQRP